MEPSYTSPPLFSKDGGKQIEISKISKSETDKEIHFSYNHIKSFSGLDICRG